MVQGQYSDEGLRAVVRGGYHPRREVYTGIGSVEVQMPKAPLNTDEAVTFHSQQLVLPNLRRTNRLAGYFPYLHTKCISLANTPLENGTRNSIRTHR